MSDSLQPHRQQPTRLLCPWDSPGKNTGLGCHFLLQYMLITTLNVNRLNAPTKRHRQAGWVQNQDPYACCLQETHLRLMDTCRLKVRGWEKVFHANGNHKKAGVVILISDKIDFKTKTVRWDKEGHYIMKKSFNNYNYIQTQQTSTSIHKSNCSKHKGEINSNTITVGGFNTSLSSVDKSSRQKIDKEM